MAAGGEGMAGLVPDRKNANRGTVRGRALLEDSLRRYGAGRSILADKHGNVIAGNKTLEASADIGLPVRFVESDGTDLIVVRRTDLDLDTDTAARELAYADNRIASLDLDWDVEQLLADRDAGIDLAAVGFDADELAALLSGIGDDPAEGLTDPDAVPPVPADPITRPGDLWTLGRHRLGCLDSSDPLHLDRLCAGMKVTMVYTDPPYGMDLDADWSGAVSSLAMLNDKGLTGGRKYDAVIGDDAPFDPALLLSYFGNAREIFLWGADYYAESLPEKNTGSWVVWDKRLDESADRMYGSCFELCWSKSRHRREIARVKWAGVFGTEREFDRKRQHPTQKPTALAAWFFERWAKPGDVIADLYAGVGSALIACEQANLTFVGAEISPAYCDVIVTRWQDFTGLEARRA